MITYVNTVLVSNASAATLLNNAPVEATSISTPSADAGKFIATDIENGGYEVDETTEKFKIGIVTKNNVVKRKRDENGKITIKYVPVIKWSNIINRSDIKSVTKLTATDSTEDVVTVDFSELDDEVLSKFNEGGKVITVRLTFKDLPTRFRKWTESYTYVTKTTDTKETIAEGIASVINKDYKRARVVATATGAKVAIEAMPYDDDNSNESLNWAEKVRFNVNLYYTDPSAAAFASSNKYFPTGVTISKVPGKAYAASGKLVRDRESIAQGYEGILNRGCGTWPIIKPAIEADINTNYDAITVEFENMYRAADDIHRKTKQTVEIYGHGLDTIASSLFA